MKDFDKIKHYKSTMLLNSHGASRLLATWFSDMLNLPTRITENEFKSGVEFCKAKKKLELEENSTQMSEDEKKIIENDIEQQIENLSAILKDILTRNGTLIP